MRRRVGPAAPVSRFTFWWSLRDPYHTVVCLLLSLTPALSSAGECTSERASERTSTGKLKLNEGPFRAYKGAKRKRYTLEGPVDLGDKKPVDRYRDTRSKREYCISRFYLQSLSRDIYLRDLSAPSLIVYLWKQPFRRRPIDNSANTRRIRLIVD